MNIILASASPRRRELLGLVTEKFTIDVPVGEEFCPDTVCAQDRPEFLACKKAGEVAARNKNALIIAADTAVFADGCMLGKPENEEDAHRMLSLLSGRVHTVVTGCCIALGERRESFSVTTEVEFYPLTDGEIVSYIATKEPLDKAGAYGIQGKGSVLVRGIKGDYFNVVGLPVAELSRRLKTFF